MQSHFLLVRHGETEWNQQRKLQGHLDSPLTDSGINQARLLALQLANQNINSIFTSPLKRASDTALIINQSLNKSISTDERLKERHFGDWQEKYFDELTHLPDFEFIFQKSEHHAPPNGESGIICANRMEQALIDIAKQHLGKNILIVSHGDIIRCFFQQKLHQSAAVDAYSGFGNGSVFKVSFCHYQEQFI